jgi:hypothetical protein
METNNACVIDKITKLTGHVVDVSTGVGSIIVYVKLENGETVNRALNAISFVGGEKK